MYNTDAIDAGPNLWGFPRQKDLPECMVDVDQECCSAALRRSVLVVEDQPGYLELIDEIISESFPDLLVQTARDGEEAWRILGRAIATDEIMFSYPSLIISDLNLLKLSGLELLTRIKQDEYLQAIPVVIFSTSQSEEDIFRCYQAQANCYITKPNNIEDFFTVVQDMVAFWLNVATLPTLPAR